MIKVIFIALIVLSACSRKNKTALPKEITVTAKRFAVAPIPKALSPNDATATFEYNGETYFININRVDESSRDGSIKIMNTDMGGTNCSVIASPIAANGVQVLDFTLPNSIVLTMPHNKKYSKITINFDADTKLYFEDEKNSDAYLQDNLLFQKNFKTVIDLFNNYQPLLGGDPGLPVTIQIID